MFGKICNIISTLIIILLVLIAGFLLVPRLMGYENLTVISGSMEPDIPVGSMVFVKDTKAETLKEGDVITYAISDDTMVTHRIVALDQASQTITTKGDANNSNDAEPVSFENVVGEVKLCVPYVGYVSMQLRTPLGIAIGCGVLIILILLTFLPGILNEENNKKKKATEVNNK